MDTRWLELFVDTARSGSFAAAARRHDLDPSSVSRAVAALESDFGARLFQRSTRQLSLTEEGARFLDRVEPLLSELGQAREDALSATVEPRGKLRVSTSVAFGTHWLIPRLGGFLEDYPGIDIELDVSDRNVDLVAERIDLAVRLGPPLDSGMIGTRLMSTRYRVVGAASQTILQSPDAIADRDCVCMDLPGFRSTWTFRSPDGALSTISVRPRLLVGSAIALREAAVAGLGCALLPDWLIGDDIASGRLVDLLQAYDVTATGFDTAAWLLYPSRSFLPERTRRMIDYLRQAASE